MVELHFFPGHLCGSQRVKIAYYILFWGGEPGLSLLRTLFWAMGRGWWLRHVPTTLGCFWVYTRNIAHVRPRRKNVSKNENRKEWDWAKLFTPFDVSTSWSFDVVVCQNRIKNGRVIQMQSWGKGGVLAYFGLKIGYCGHIFCFSHHLHLY